MTILFVFSFGFAAASTETTRYALLHTPTPGHSSNMANPEEGKSLISHLLLIESSPHRRLLGRYS